MTRDPDYERVLTNEYLEWLVKFIKKWGNFTDDRWEYRKEQITILDYNRVRLLTKLFTAVSEYCNDNYIAAKEDKCEIYYPVEIKGDLYRIGLVIGQGAFTFISKEEDKVITQIKLEKIIKGLPIDGLQNKEEAVKNFMVAVAKCNELGIPMGTLNYIIKELT